MFLEQPVKRNFLFRRNLDLLPKGFETFITLERTIKKFEISSSYFFIELLYNTVVRRLQIVYYFNNSDRFLVNQTNTFVYKFNVSF